MSKHALRELQPDEKTVKRAQYEAWEFELEAPGLMVVRNMSHETPSDHEYVVNVEDGVPVACECPSFEYRGGPCKHQVAIAIREPVLTAASDHDAGAEVATDGGQILEERPGQEDRVPGVSLALEVATVTSRGRATLPNEDVYMASCECAQATVERLIDAEA